MSSNGGAIEFFYPEIKVGGYSRVDGTVEFYQRINALLSPSDVLLDIGAGRGAAHSKGEQSFRGHLRTFRGRCAKVIGLDIDDAVKQNHSLDEAMVIEGKSFPIDRSIADIAFADWVLEHIEDPYGFSAEVHRTLKVGGWFCARTPNRWGYISLASRLIPKRAHAAVLHKAQPERTAEDIFPTFYRMNTASDLTKAFPPDKWEVVIYAHNAEPAYFGNNRMLWRLAMLLFRLSPPGMGAILFLFARKL